MELIVKGATIQDWDLFLYWNVQLAAFCDYCFWSQFSAVKTSFSEFATALFDQHQLLELAPRVSGYQPGVIPSSEVCVSVRLFVLEAPQTGARSLSRWTQVQLPGRRT